MKEQLFECYQAIAPGAVGGRISISNDTVRKQWAVERRDNRPGIAPETPDQNKPKRGEGDEHPLNPLKIFAERSLHTGEASGSPPKRQPKSP